MTGDARDQESRGGERAIELWLRQALGARYDAALDERLPAEFWALLAGDQRSR